MSDVFFTKWDPAVLMTKKCLRLYEKAGTFDCVDKDDLVAIKLHVGEYGNPTHLNPLYVKDICDEVTRRGGKPFLTDSSTLYPGKRTNAYDHYKTALAHGFGACAPWFPADGLRGNHGIKVATKGLLTEIEVAGMLAEADAMIVVSHVKGHVAAGVGAAIKNLAMGGTTPEGKRSQHVAVGMEWRIEERCKGCGRCVDACFMGAITLAEGHIVVDTDKCMCCGFCKNVCENDVMVQSNRNRLPRALASAAWGVLTMFPREKVSYVNFAMNITPKCDCVASPGAPVHEDIGVFASDSAVSVDAAVFNIIGEALSARNKSNCFEQIEQMLEFGCPGSKDPRIIDV